MIKHNINNFIILLLILFVFIIIYFTFNKRNNNSCCNSYIYIDNSNKGGEFMRGVFANKDYKQGEIIEVGPLLVGDKNNMTGGLYKNYIWAIDNKIVLPLGYASICNHSDDNNSEVIFNNNYYKLIAMKDIKKDEEILVTYCKGLNKEACEYWFTSKNIKKIE